MVGVVCALYDEALLLARSLSFNKNGQFFEYTGSIDGVGVSLILVSPGVKKKAR